MPVTVAASGAQTATLATDHTLVTQAGPTGGAVYVLAVDANALVAGETLTLTLSTRARSGDTTRRAWSVPISGPVADPLLLSPVVPVEAGNELVAILRQEGGTGRSFPWTLKRIDG
jgi:hypothetical protein